MFGELAELFLRASVVSAKKVISKKSCRRLQDGANAGKKGRDLNKLRPRYLSRPFASERRPPCRSIPPSWTSCGAPSRTAPLVLDGDRLVSTDRKTRRSYRVEDGDLPVMVIEESEVLDEPAWLGIMQRHGVKTS